MTFVVELQASTAESIQQRVYDVVDSRKNSVVQVFAAISREDNKGNTEANQRSKNNNLLFVASGFAISKEGHILTNTSITYGADRVWIEFKGIEYKCEIIGHDLVTNLSILKMKEMPENLDYVQMSENAPLPPVGSFAVAITRQIGLPPSPLLGMVLGHNIRIANRMLPTTYLRVDIPSETGESGAPVYDFKGELVGVVVTSLPDVRSSFVIPVRAIRRVRDQILFSDKPQYAYFGVQATTALDKQKNRYIMIQQIKEGSPAERAGLQIKDLIQKIGDTKIHDERDLRDALFFLHPEQKVDVTVLREGETKTLTVKVGKREIPEPEGKRNAARKAAIPGEAVDLRQAPLQPDATTLPKQSPQAPANEQKTNRSETNSSNPSQESSTAN